MTPDPASGVRARRKFGLTQTAIARWHATGNAAGRAKRPASASDCAGTESAVVASRRTGLALAAIFAIWLVSALRWYLSDGVVPWDSKNQFFPFFRFLAESLHAGTSIFWNPYHYGGHPSIADPQSLVFSPPFLLWAWLDPVPTFRVFDLIVYAHLLVGGLAIALLGARREWPAAASIVAAVVFMLGGSASARLNHTGIILCYGVFPLALLLLEVALERRSRLAMLAFASVAATIVLARNQVALMLCLVLALFAAREVALAERPLTYLRQRLPLLAMAGFVIAAITVIPILLTLQLAALSNRPAVALVDALQASLSPANLATLLAPNIFGSHAPGFNYWGPQHSITPEVGATDESFNYLFIGLGPAVVLLWFGLAAGGIARKGCRTLALLLLVATLFAFGRYTPLFSLVFDYAPGFTFFRRPVDATFVMLLAMALLCGELIARFAQQGIPEMRPFCLAVVLAGVIWIFAAAWQVSMLTGQASYTLISAAISVVLAGALVAVVRVAGVRQRRAVAAGIAVLAAAELLSWNTASRLNSEHRRHYDVLETASSEEAEALRLLSGELRRRHLEGARPRVEVVGLNGPWQNLSMVYKLEATNGYNPLRIGLYDKFVAPGESSWVAQARHFPKTFDRYDCALARALGLEYLVLDRPIEKLDVVRWPRMFEMLLAGPKIWIYRIPGAMPRVAFSSRIEVADVDATTSSGELSHPPALDRVVIDDETLPSSGLVWMRAVMATSTAQITSWQPGRVEISVEAAHAGVLVLHDTYYPGWIAEVDGKRVPILRAEVLFRAVEVPAGSHTIVFRFEPLSPANLASAVALVAGAGKRLTREED